MQQARCDWIIVKTFSCQMYGKAESFTVLHVEDPTHRILARISLIGRPHDNDAADYHGCGGERMIVMMTMIMKMRMMMRMMMRMSMMTMMVMTMMMMNIMLIWS
jgi:hypothetical protein